MGVAPANFTSTTMGEEPAAYLPMSFKPLMTPNWNGTDKWNDYWIYVFARLKPGQTRQQAAAALNSTYSGLVEQQASMEHSRSASKQKRFRESRLSLVEGSHGHSSFRDDARTPLLILMAATGMVLLIAMANAANLLLARSAERRRELAIRAAMGAGRGELMGQLFTEALLLAAGGGLAGLALGRDQHTAADHADRQRGDDPLPERRPGLESASVRPGAFRGHRTAVRAVSGMGRRPGIAGYHAKGRIRAVLVDARQRPGAQAAGVRAGHDLGGAADPHRTIPEEPGQPAERRSRHEDGEPDRLLGVAGPERLQERAKPRAVRAHGEPNWRRFRECAA